MATRILLGALSNVGTFLGYDASIASGSASRYFAAPSTSEKAEIGAVTKAVSETSSLRGQITNGQWSLPGLDAQTITGTIKGQIVCSATAASGAHLALIVRVMSAQGVVRGTLYASDLTATSVSGTPGDLTYEISSTPTNRKLPSGWSGAGASLTSVDAEVGDHLVITVGVRYTNTATTSYTYTMYLGQHDTDLPEDETETSTTMTPWIEFSQTLAFANDNCLTPDQIVMTDVSRGVLGAAVPTVGQTWPRGVGSC